MDMMDIKIVHCKVCNHVLNISKDNVYVANVTSVFFHTSENYSATDCPYCGCQNLLQKRFEKSGEIVCQKPQKGECMCKFCEAYECAKELEKESGIQSNYYAVLRERSVVNGKEKGELNHRPVKLVYCPSCGKKLI